MDEWLHDLKWNAIAYGIVAGVCVVGLAGMWLFMPALRQRWLPMPRLRPGAWAGRDVFLAFCIGMGFPLFIAEFLLQLGFFTPLIGPTPSETSPRPERLLYIHRCVAISSPLALAVILGLLFAVMYARTGTRPHHYGLSWARWPTNLALGIVAFVVSRPVIIGVFAVAELIFSQAAHPYKALGEIDFAGWEWAFLAFQTVVMAPLLEEILFRGILQGWLRRATLVGHITLPFLIVFFAAKDFVRYDDETKTYAYEFAALAFAIVLAGVYAVWLHRLRRRFELTAAETQRWQLLPDDGSLAPSEDERRRAHAEQECRLQRWTDANARLALVGSAMLFAVVHPHWPDPMPIFLMGLILGWLSLRTQSLIGPITFHALFNLTTFIALYWSI